MNPVKVNIFVSYAPEDKPHLNKLLRWLYPMRDEVNIVYNNPPPRPPELSLPWQILLFWYTQPDFRVKYYQKLMSCREKAHIYLFLTSYKSLSDKNIEGDIDIAVNRRIDGDEFFGPFVFPVILSPSRWRETSRLAGFTPMASGKPLTSFKPEEEGYLKVTEEVAGLIKVLQKRLGEAKFYQSRLVSADHGMPPSKKRKQPLVAETSDCNLDAQEIAYLHPPEWLGWTILFFICFSIVTRVMPVQSLGTERYLNVPNADDHGWEYLREHPLAPPKDSIPFPPAD